MSEPLAVKLEAVASDLTLPLEQVQAAYSLLEEGYTVPFIARYRKDQTKSLDEDGVVKVEAVFKKQRQLASRKYSFIQTIEAQGKMTPELRQKIDDSRSAFRLEDLYLPFRSKRGTAAQDARDKGLEPLADAIQNAADETQTLQELAAAYVGPGKATDVEDAIAGAAKIVAERFAETFALRRALRDFVRRTCKIVTKKAEEAADAENAIEEAADAAKKSKKGRDPRQDSGKQYAEYYNGSFPLSQCYNARILTINRAEHAGAISVSVEVDPDEAKAVANKILFPTEPAAFYAFLLDCAADGVLNLALPTIKQGVRETLSERAEEQTAAELAKNLRNVLMQRPLTGRRVLAIDPGMSNAGSSVVALDEEGTLLEYETIFVHGSADREAFAEQRLAEMIEKHGVNAIAIGKGGKSREIEKFIVKGLNGKLANKGLAYIVVNDFAVYAYANSLLAQDELPGLEPGVCCAISIGRRLQNPAQEILKLDVDTLSAAATRQSGLRLKVVKDAFASEIVNSVNRIGVDLNTAPQYMLRYVSGLNALSAQNLCEYRAANGKFESREQLRTLKGVGELAFLLSSGFMRVSGSSNPLDETWIHPENYELAGNLLAKLELTAQDLFDADKRADVEAKTAQANVEELAAELGAPTEIVADLIAEFAKPGADGRDSRPQPIFKTGALKIEDLKPGMELTGCIESVVDFGAFVDVGLMQPGLVHISQISASNARKASEKVHVGDVVKAWILAVDPEKGRVSLTLVAPGTQRETGRERRGRRNENAQNERATRERRPRRTENEGEGEERREKNFERRERNFERRDRRDREERNPRSASVGPKNKKIVPITEEMKSGKEPMRSFGDLAQFYGRIQSDENREK